MTNITRSMIDTLKKATDSRDTELIKLLKEQVDDKDRGKYLKLTIEAILERHRNDDKEDQYECIKLLVEAGAEVNQGLVDFAISQGSNANTKAIKFLIKTMKQSKK